MYSQHSEDEEIDRLVIRILDKMPHIVVDIGAGDGKFLSNTKLFIEKYKFGGLMIEPSDEPFELLKKEYENNKDIICLQEAISDVEKPYVMQDGNMNGIVHWTLKNVLYTREGERRTLRLPNVLKKYEMTDVGILSIDTEGHDTRILEDLIYNSDIRPSIIITEFLSGEMCVSNIELLSEDYLEANRVEYNQIFILKKYEKDLNRTTD